MEKCKEKTPKGLLHKNTGLNLCHLCIHIKSLVSFLVQSIYVVFLLNKAEEIFLSFFCQKKRKKSHSSTHQTHIRLKFWNILSNRDLKFDRFFLSNHSSTNLCVMQTVQEMTRTSQNQREVIFDSPLPLPLAQHRFTQFPTAGPEKLDLSRKGVVTGQIEPCIIL